MGMGMGMGRNHDLYASQTKHDISNSGFRSAVQLLYMRSDYVSVHVLYYRAGINRAHIGNAKIGLFRPNDGTSWLFRIRIGLLTFDFLQLLLTATLGQPIFQTL